MDDTHCSAAPTGKSLCSLSMASGPTLAISVSVLDKDFRQYNWAGLTLADPLSSKACRVLGAKKKACQVGRIKMCVKKIC